ncbi:ABC transporter ATP-binding protein [Sphaerisporangium krabiense]|uniref:NitT/TauT family transport system ATP-binding protein n=1 Tax=Sphaerisporangium krabiense TaxID=763782 RepID=A0A7W9DPU3_9ACTN|nr:ABC transporter ATP-binding protein [Sphaerisporangium krabiense]MBB5626319.1 NitT/TauT family transport system ATP-binding protein [Sphaerisporangium krabiense]GII66016.1 ABC transporter ATP-binding protein [Sphaerisporangium krabiense]
MTAPSQELRSSRTDGHGPAVRLDAVSKVYGRELLALDRVSLSVDRAEFVCLLGASGCGKSTLLNLVAGLDHATAGTIDTQGGRVAMMFQEPALFPWLTVSANIELALRVTSKGKSTTKKERRERAAELLDIVHLTGFGGKRPHELSGGMRQRVALARSLAQEADVLLMDEPFGALDAMTRDLLHDQLERIWRERRLTVLFVTHNVREAVRLGDRVVLLSSRPGTVIHDFPVDLPRPRRTDSAEVAEMTTTITDRLRQEVLRHAKPAPQPVGAAARGDG